MLIERRVFRKAARHLFRNPLIMRNAAKLDFAHQVSQCTRKLGLEGVLVCLAFYQVDLLLSGNERPLPNVLE